MITSKKLSDQRWRKFNGDRIQLPIKDEVEQAIIRETLAGNKLMVCIGTDSQVRGDVVEFATVIVFLREKKGGFMYIHNERTKHPMTLKERLLMEVSMSINIAYDLCDLLDKYDVDLEVHADINTNPHFKSNTALSEAMGYILSMGFAFKAKPHAFASTSCANKVV
ncbi:MAG TPA: ribonuclease H-like YkuK family protein [Chitinophagales bacterium]|nr:ribonuclease H-like YkuK family protein [Chitinophagales bacterium]